MDRRFLLFGFLALVTVGADDASALKRKKGSRKKGSRRAVRAVGGGGGSGGGGPFSSCKEAHAAGRYGIREGQSGYSYRLDRDRDGIACE